MVGKGILGLWLFGGNSNNGSNCGLAYANSNNGWTYSNANYSARHTTWSGIGDGVGEQQRVQVLRHGKAPVYPAPRRRDEGHVTGRNNIHLAWRGVSPATRGVSKPKGFESPAKKR